MIFRISCRATEQKTLRLRSPHLSISTSCRCLRPCRSERLADHHIDTSPSYVTAKHDHITHEISHLNTPLTHNDCHNSDNKQPCIVSAQPSHSHVHHACSPLAFFRMFGTLQAHRRTATSPLITSPRLARKSKTPRKSVLEVMSTPKAVATTWSLDKDQRASRGILIQHRRRRQRERATL